jgi:hypothetical protein
VSRRYYQGTGIKLGEIVTDEQKSRTIYTCDGCGTERPIGYQRATHKPAHEGYAGWASVSVLEAPDNVYVIQLDVCEECLESKTLNAMLRPLLAELRKPRVRSR